MTHPAPSKPTAAFVGASWAALLVGTAGFVIGLWNAQMQLNEKGYIVPGLGDAGDRLFGTK